MIDGHEIERVNDENYREFLAVPASVVVFGIASCVPCNEFDPIIRMAAQEFGGMVKFGKALMHIPGACRELKKQYTFETFPTSHFYKKGVLVHIEQEKLSLSDLEERIKEHLLV